MYRAKTDNNYFEEEQKALFESNLTQVSENKASVGLILKQLGSITGAMIVVMFLALAVKSDIDPISFSVFKSENKQLETFVQDSEKQDILDEREKSKFKFYPEESLVLVGEIFSIDLFYNFEGEEVSLPIYFDNRNLKLIKIDFNEEIDGNYENSSEGGKISFGSEIRGEVRVASLTFEAINEGLNEIRINGESCEVNIISSIFEVPQVASCSANLRSNLFGLEAKSGPKLGEVSLFWQGNIEEDLGLKYGKNQYNLEYGIENINKVNQITISNLEAGQEYYFRIFGKDDCYKLNNYYETKAKAGYGAMTEKSIEDYNGILPVTENLIP